MEDFSPTTTNFSESDQEKKHTLPFVTVFVDSMKDSFVSIFMLCELLNGCICITIESLTHTFVYIVYVDSPSN